MSDAQLPETGPNVPLTVLTGIQPTWVSAIAIGTNKLTPPPKSAGSGFWCVIVDLVTLGVDASVVATDFTTVPPDIQPYLGQENKLLIFMTMVATFDQIPQGALFTALKTAGAGAVLDRAEQINTTLGTGHFTYYGYSLVCTTESDNMPGFEEFNFADGNMVLTCQLMPVTIGGKTYYTPIAVD